MYRLIEQRKNIKSFKSINNKLLEVRDSGLYFDDDFISDNVDSYNFDIHGDNLIYLKGEETFIGETSVSKSILINSIVNDFALFSSEFSISDFTLRYEFVNLNSQEVVLDLGNKPSIKAMFAGVNNVYLNFGNEIICYSCKDAVEKKWFWSIDGDIERIIGVFEEQLIVACTNHRIYTIDIQDGNTTYKYQEVPGLDIGMDYQNVIPKSTDFVLDKREGKLVGLFHTYLIEILLNQNEISYVNLAQEMKDYGINSFRRFVNNAIDDRYIYAVGHKVDSSNSNVEFDSLVILNRRTNKVEWQYDFREVGLGTNTPVIDDNLLYQKDLNNGLHVFRQVDQLA